MGSSKTKIKPRKVRIVKKAILRSHDSARHQDSETDTDRPAETDLARSVRFWIEEHRENGRLESIVSLDAIAAWKELPDIS